METSGREQWKRIPRYPNYWVSNKGRVRHRKKIVSFYGVVNGYKVATISLGDYKQTTVYVHRMMLEAFVGPCPEGHRARFLDRNKANVSLDNVVWAEYRQTCKSVADIVGDDIQQYRELYDSGMTIKAMAKKLNVNYGALWMRLVSLGIHTPKPYRQAGDM